MDWLKSLAPLLGTALGGPLGGAAASFIADKLQLSGSTVEVVTEALTSGKLTPDQLAQVKLAEVDFRKFLEQNKIDLFKLEVQDRSSARDMQIALRSRMPAVLTVMITFGFFSVLGWMLYDDSVVDSPPLLIMLGSLGTAWTGVCAYWFGTTKGSADKNMLIAQQDR